MKPLRILGWLALALAAGLLPACKGSSGNRTKLAFISNNEYEFWRFAQSGTEKAAKDFDVDVEFKMPSGGGSAEQQRRFIEDLLAKGVKGIAISPNDATNQVAFLKEVNGQVPLLTQDSDVPDTSARRCYIGTNNVEAGKAAGELVKQAAPGGGKIVIYVGKLDVQNAVERRKGLVVALAGGEDKCRAQLAQLEEGQYPIRFGDYELLDTMTDDGKQEVCRQKVDDTLSKHPDVRCLIGLWAYNPPAMREAVKAARMAGKVALVGFDENEETLQGIKDGHIYGTIVQNPYEFGYQAVKILAGLARGDESVLKRPDIDEQKRIFIPHRIVTKEGGPTPQHLKVEDFHAEIKRLKGN